MADLLSVRETESYSFERVGVDFFGLISKYYGKKFRNRTKLKSYGCIFLCMSSKTLHSEIVSKLSTIAFSATFKRFVWRRVLPSDVFLDNDTITVGANN